MSVHPKFRTDLTSSDYIESDGFKSIVIKNPVSDTYYRLSDYEYRLLKILDGTISVEQARARLKMEGRYYSWEQANGILDKASQMGLVLGTSFGTAAGQMTLKAFRKRVKKLKKIAGIFFLYVPILNPDRFLERTLWIFNILFNRFSLFALTFLGLIAAYLIVAGVPKIQNEFLFFFNSENLVCLWLVIGMTKITHELAHAYVAKSFGLHVNTMGIVFLLFVPCLYCDTNEAWKLSGRRQRILISAAGIAAELSLAILAVYIWNFSKPGIVNSLAFYLIVVSTVSTIFFNGNPLLKFDGYFILMDYLRMPNLAGNALGYVKYLFMNKTLGIASVQSPAVSDRESTVFAVYGIASIIYRFFLYFGIVAGLYFRFDKMVGLTLALGAFLFFVARPLYYGLIHIWEKREEANLVSGRAAATACIILVVFISVCWPWADKSLFPCFIESAKIQKLTVPLHSSVAKVSIHEGMEIAEGTLMFQLEPVALEFALAKAHLEMEVLRNSFDMLTLDDKGHARLPEKAVELYRADAGIRKIQMDLKLASTGIIAPFDGVVTTLDSRMQPGFQPGEGAVVGELKSPTDCVVHALVPGSLVHEIHEGQAVKIWFPLKRGAVFDKRIDRLRSCGERNLRDSSFSSLRGGEIAVELHGRSGIETPLEEQYLCSISFPQNKTVPLGMTGRLVVYSHPQSALARLFGAAVRTFNRESLL
jgi:putative peptide zinc metalloprotease protein